MNYLNAMDNEQLDLNNPRVATYLLSNLEIINEYNIIKNDHKSTLTLS
jgi:hypothetical protein